MATVEPQAAGNSGRWIQHLSNLQSSVASNRTLLRRAQRRGHLQALQLRLLVERDLRLQAEAKTRPPEGEVAQRLSMATPVLEAELAGQEPLQTDRMRRNAAMHAFSVSAATISQASRPALNALQRSQSKQVNKGTAIHRGAHSSPAAQRNAHKEVPEPMPQTKMTATKETGEPPSLAPTALSKERQVATMPQPLAEKDSFEEQRKQQDLYEKVDQHLAVPPEETMRLPAEANPPQEGTVLNSAKLEQAFVSWPGAKTDEDHSSFPVAQHIGGKEGTQAMQNQCEQQEQKSNEYLQPGIAPGPQGTPQDVGASLLRSMPVSCPEPPGPAPTTPICPSRPPGNLFRPNAEDPKGKALSLRGSGGTARGSGRGPKS